MFIVEQAYVQALLVELSRARDEQHAAEVKAELARVGAPVVETADATPAVETAAVTKSQIGRAHV